MKKVISVVLLLTLFASLFAGCHGNIEREAFALPEGFDDSRQYEISFWAKNDSNVNQVNIYKQAIADFEALYPNIKVNLKLYTNYGNIYNDVITNIATNTTPNICITYPDHIATYLTGNNTVVPLNDLMADSQYGLGGSELKFDGPEQGEIVNTFLDECRLSGSYYAMPFMRSTEACYVNVDFVEALGYTMPDVLTWDFIWEVSEAAMAKNEDGTFVLNGQSVLIPFIYKSTDNMMIQMLQQAGAGYSTENGEVQIFNNTTKEILYTVADHTETRAFSTFKISSYPGNYLNAGQCIFAIDSTAGATWMGPDAPLTDIAEDKMVKFNMAVMGIPQFDTQNPQMISQGPSMCLFNKEDPQEVLASWLFMQFLLTNDVQIAYSQTEGYVPVTTKAQNSEQYQDYLGRCGEDNDMYYWVKIEAAQLLLDNVENTFVTPVFNGSASLRDAAGQMIEEVAKGVRRKKTVNDAFLEKLFSDMTSLYRLDQIQQVKPDENQQNTPDQDQQTEDPQHQLGPLPDTAIILLSALAVTWIGIGIYAVLQRKKKKLSFLLDLFFKFIIMKLLIHPKKPK